MYSNNGIDTHLTQTQRQVMLGGLLGDLCIIRRKPTHNAYIAITHSMKQIEYVEWKYNILKNIAVSPPVPYVVRVMGKEYNTVELHTRRLPCITEIYNLMGAREITHRWLDEITEPIAIAVWYMDDGCCYKIKNGYAMEFSTGHRNQNELDLLTSWMHDVFGLDGVKSYIPPTRPTATVLKIHRKQDARKFEEIIRPYIIPSMQYKLPTFRLGISRAGPMPSGSSL